MGKDKFEETRLIFINQMEDFLQRSLFSEALGLSRERLADYPDDADALSFAGLLLIAKGELAESRDILRRIDKNISRLSAVYLEAAERYAGRGLNKDAVFCYRKFISFNPQAECAAEVVQKIALLEEKYLPNAGAEEADDVALPKPEFYTVTLADLYIKQGHLKLAKDMLQEIIVHNPSNTQAKAKLDQVLAMLSPPVSAVNKSSSPDQLIKILSSWLENIGRLKNVQ